MARQKKEKRSPPRFVLKYQPFNPERPDKWGMRFAVPRKTRGKSRSKSKSPVKTKRLTASQKRRRHATKSK